MNAEQARAIGHTVTNLLLHADREGLHLTSWPINVREANLGDKTVELRTCRDSGADYEARVTVAENGVVHQVAAIREWDAAAQQMGEWRYDGIEGVTP